jgi:arylsulfatase A-like enzyme
VEQFLFLHLFDPHWPYLPPAKLIERFGERPPDISDLLDLAKERRQPPSSRDIQHIVNLYDAEIASADNEIGRLFDALRLEGLYDEALIIVTADHGEAFYEHGHWQHSITLYDELLRVPLIVKWPGRPLRGRVDTLVSHVDIFPTILDEMGIPVSAPSSGVSLRKYAEGKDDACPREVISEFNWRLDDQNFVKVSFRDSQLKYVATVSIPAGEEISLDMIQEEELFDLAGDPEEQHDISAKRPESLRTFKKKLLDHLIRSRNIRSIYSGEDVLLDEAMKEQLRNLGYIHE